jgi:hypothetical protein
MSTHMHTRAHPQTALRRVSMLEFLPDGDGLHSGDITRSKFRCALTRAGLSLKGAEMETLERAFADRRRPDHVFYKDFFEALKATPLPKEDRAEAQVRGLGGVGPEAQYGARGVGAPWGSRPWGVAARCANRDDRPSKHRHRTGLRRCLRGSGPASDRGDST